MKIERFTPDMPDLELKEKFAEVWKLLETAAIGEGVAVEWTKDEFKEEKAYELCERLEKLVKKSFPPRTIKREYLTHGIRLTRKNPPKSKPKKVQP